MDTKSGRGVQVMKIASGQSGTQYQLNEEALEQILMQDDVKDLPVVIVSVAGAYRGGKSFLLDFFLRFLYSEYVEKNGGWLGAEDEPLRGFSWSTGCERDTIGILLWSQPIRATLPSGETVAVVLMDTQGTFDSRSTVRDCSTIFALSTLLSSVQIYNISQNINEDHLQHLQLFTEYGRMVSIADREIGKPFQILQFLIRDWSFPFEHPYGASGGMQLLDKRLQIDSEQPKELQEIREHIRSCFETVGCFLMPHPGFAVTDPNFDGRLSEIRQEFKDSLLELVSSLFTKGNLKLKMLHGQPLKCRDIFYYFKMYMKEFNSDKLTTPLSIMQATIKASLLSAAAETRQMYQDVMDGKYEVKRDGNTPLTVDKLHRAAKDAALKTFSAKGKMGSQCEIDACLEELMKELDDQLPRFQLINKGKIERAVARAIKVYEGAVNEFTRADKICLHPLDLEDLHQKGLMAAMHVFDSSSHEWLADDEKTYERKNLLELLYKRKKYMRLNNEAHNELSVNLAYYYYRETMSSRCNPNSGITRDDLKELHVRNKNSAIQMFHDKRNVQSSYQDDNYLDKLVKLIEDKYKEFVETTNRNNNSAPTRDDDDFNVFRDIILPLILPFPASAAYNIFRPFR